MCVYMYVRARDVRACVCGRCVCVCACVWCVCVYVCECSACVRVCACEYVYILSPSVADARGLHASTIAVDGGGTAVASAG